MQIDNSSIRREHILSDVNILLESYGFKTSNIYDRSCFDLLAKKDDILIILKILVNMDSLTTQQAEELRKVAGTFLASPIIVSFKSKSGYLEDDVVYERHEIPVISPQTLCDIIAHNIHPEILAKRGGYYVQINGDIIKDYREKENISLKKLADLTHVSRETIYKFEQGITQTYPETAYLIEKILNEPVTVSINILKKEKENSIDEKIEEPKELINLGFEIRSSNKTPFDAISKESSNTDINKIKSKYEERLIEIEKLQKEINKSSSDNKLLLTNLDRNRRPTTLSKIATNTKDIADITGHNALFILEHKQENNSINRIPIIYTWELDDMDKAADVLKLIKEREDESED